MAICPECNTLFEQMAPWQKICKSCYKKQKQKDSVVAPSEGAVYLIDSLMLRRLKQLTHPDKHSDSELSNTVMKLLNTLKPI